MRRFLTHFFTVIINFYFMTYLIGIGLMFLSIVLDGLKPMVGILAMLTVLIMCVIYEIYRQKFNFQSFGEHIVGNSDKADILIQSKNVTITRIPLFILIFLTFAISGNLLDGLSEGQVFSFGTIILFGILTMSLYHGIRNFVISYKPNSLLLIIFGQMLTGLAFKFSPKAQLTGDLMFKIYSIISFIWIIIGVIYILKKVKQQTPNNV